MAGRLLATGLCATLLVVLLIGVPVGAQCPPRINDCGEWVEMPALPVGSFSGAPEEAVRAIVSASSFEATATMAVKDGAVRAGSTTTIHLTLRATGAVANGTIVRVGFDGSSGAVLADGDGYYEFPYPGGATSGEIDVEVTASARGAVSLPFFLEVRTPDGATQRDVAVLSAGVAGKSTGSWGAWLMPAVLGVLVGAAFTAVVMRRKP